MPRTRRDVLRAGIAAGIVSSAGCLGNDGGDGNENTSTNTDGGGGGRDNTPTSTVTTTSRAEQGPPNAAESPDEWRKYASEKAKEEGGTVNFWVNRPRESLVNTVVERDFQGVYKPLSPSLNGGSSQELYEKYSSEIQANQGTMDVGLFAYLTLFPVQGVPLADLSNIPGFIDTPDILKDGTQLGAMGLKGADVIYNTDRVSDPPTSWDDIVSSRFEGETITGWDVQTNLKLYWMNHNGEDWLRALGNNADLIDSVGNAMFSVYEGEFKICPFGVLTPFFKDQGNPVDYVEDLTTLIPNPLGIGENPPHPWSARLFFDFLTRPDHAEEVQLSVAPGTITNSRDAANPDNEQWRSVMDNDVAAMSRYDNVQQQVEQYYNLIGAPVVQ